MAVKVHRIKIRPSTNVEFHLDENDVTEEKILAAEEKMLHEGKILSIVNQLENDLEVHKIFIFADALSMFEYFFFYKNDADLAKSDYDNDIYCIQNGIERKYEIDWNFEF